jgi:hypothetical protein
MRDWLRWALIACLAVVYVLALLAVLHPRISQAYRAHFIDRTSVDWNPPHYRATPEEGMVFSEPGLPDWVAWTYGLTVSEPRGRWTDDDLGNVAGLMFDRAFEGTFCVEFRAAPAQPMRGPFDLRFGSQSETLQVKGPEFAEYQAQFNDVRNARQLEFVLPKKLPRVHEYDPPNGDRRRLGLLLSTLKIRAGSCSQAH